MGKINIEIDDKQAQQFEKYGNMLREWNTVMNLTGITDKREIVIKHFADSVVPLNLYDFKGKSVIDIGTGAGFPGIPIKIAEPSTEYIHGRAEELGQDRNYREKYDIAISRAVAPLNVLAEYSLPYI